MNRLLRQAFTLIELLVVIAIIGILSGLIVVSMGGMTDKATIAKAQVFSNSLRNSLMMNLASEWNFNSFSGTVGQEISTTSGFVSDSWGSNHGTAVGSPVFKTGSSCITGNCLSFNGSTDYISVPPPLSAGQANYTIAAWFNVSSTTGGGIVWEQNHSTLTANRRSALLIHSSGYWGFNGESNDAHDKVPVKIGKWVYGVITIEKNAATNPVKIYENGVLYWQGNTSAGAVNLNLGSSLAAIGEKVVNNTEFFNGLIDDVRIYNVMISALQIQEQYYSGLNKLLNSGNISKEEYISRINNLISKK